MDRPSPSKLLRFAAWAALVALGALALHLALHRIYQVDEAQNVYMARIVARRECQAFFVNGSFFTLGPLAWIAGTGKSSAWIWDASRLYALGIFLTNTFLLALATGLRPKDRRFLVVLLGAATLAPLWDYGFEVRHDNLMLALILGSWIAGRRPSGSGWATYGGLGFLAAMLQFVAFKSFLYTLPLAGAFLLLPRAEGGPTRLRRVGMWIGGALAAALLARLAYGLSGSWDAYVNGFRTSFDHALNPGRFPAWDTLYRLVEQVPLLVIGGGAGVARLGYQLIRNKDAWTWEGPLPEGVLMIGTLGILLINPVPYAYNLLFVVPFLFLFGVRWLLSDPWLQEWPLVSQKAGHLLLAGMHVVPFCIATPRHLSFTNERQVELMRLAEALTADTDPVYDAAGLVVARRSIHYQWFLHSLVMPKYRDGRLPHLSQSLSEVPSPVFIRSYRTDWLPPSEQVFIGAHYVALSDDFLVLGSLLTDRPTAWTCLKPGRYVLVAPSDPSASALVDDRSVNAGEVIHLQAGSHALRRIKGAGPVALAWIGPTLDRYPPLTSRLHDELFINWY
jgi:hypothetical protein